MEKIAVVTGAGSGIGRATALALIDGGFRVVLAGRRRGALEETAAAAPPGRSLVVPTDVTVPGQVDTLFRTARERFDRVDVLFNNAGLSKASAFENISFEQWNALLAVNTTGTFLCAQAAFRAMKSQLPRGGRIINNGSISAHAPRPNSAAYTAAKHAVTGLTKAISLDGRRYDIACGQIDLGNAESEMPAERSKAALQPNGETAVEPLMDVENVARTVAFMASLPLDANVQFVMVMPSKMPFVGRG